MKRRLIKIEEYLDAAEAFHWAYKEHYIRWFFGKKMRHQRSEKVLRKLLLKGKLTGFIYGKKMVYCLKRKSKGNGMYPLLNHGLGCTECLVRLYTAKQGVAVPEKYFRGMGAVPDFGILYDGTMLLVEYSTKSNFLYSGNMRGKIDAYRRNLEKIESKFNAKAVVLFVLDVPRPAVERFVGSVGGVPPPYNGDTFPEPFYFVDYETFLSIDPGNQLSAPIYFWSDGKEYPLVGR